MRIPLLLLACAAFSVTAAAQSPMPPIMGPVPAVESGDCSPVVAARTTVGIDIGYANLFYFAHPVRHAFASIATDSPENPNDILVIEASSVAGAFVPDGDSRAGGYIYELTWPDGDGVSHLLKRDPETGEVEYVGPSTPEQSDRGDPVEWTDMAYDHASGILYAVATTCLGLSYLYSINLETAAPLLLATFVAAACLISLAIGLDGFAYALDVTADQLFRINLATFAIAALAQGIGYTTGFAQGAAFSPLLGLFFLATVQTFDRAEATGCGDRGQLPQGQLRTADVDDNGELTGSTTLIGNITASGYAQPMYFTFTTIPEISNEPVATESHTFELSAAHPNPLADEAILFLRLAHSEAVTARVFDSLGRLVMTLHEGLIGSETLHRIAFPATGLPSGLYFIHVQGESFTATRKAVIQR